jgi:hypothetical protein
VIRRNYEDKIDKRPGAFTFGSSRELFRKVYLKENKQPDPSFPGPQCYDVKRKLTERSPSSYSLRPKTPKDRSF